MSKICSYCKAEKPTDSFHNSLKAKDGKQHRCKVCAKNITQNLTKTWRSNSSSSYKTSIRKGHTKRKYGLTIDQIQTLLSNQNGSCKICKRQISFDAHDKCDKPHIDHCHKTGKVRGLLCLTCNTGIGMFGDSVELLDKAKNYLLLSVRD